MDSIQCNNHICVVWGSEQSRLNLNKHKFINCDSNKYNKHFEGPLTDITCQGSLKYCSKAQSERQEDWKRYK